MSSTMWNVRSKLIPHQSIRELQCPLFWHDVVYEVIITASVAAGVVWALNNVNPIMYTLSITHFAFFAATLIFSYSEGFCVISGTFFNPAVALAFFLVGRISLARLVFFTIAEIGGAASGALIAFSLTPLEVQAKFHPILPSDGLLPAQGMVIEAILTFNSIMVALSVTSQERAHSIPFLPIGFCVGSGILSGGSYTGGLQNPIIPFGPAVVAKNFDGHWLYWAGGYIGAIVAALCFEATCYMKKRYQDNLNLTVTTPSPNDEKTDGADLGHIQQQQQQQQQVSHRQLERMGSDSIRKREKVVSHPPATRQTSGKVMSRQSSVTTSNPAYVPV